MQYSGNNLLALVHNDKLLTVDRHIISPEIDTVTLNATTESLSKHLHMNCHQPCPANSLFCLGLAKGRAGTLSARLEANNNDENI